MSFIARGRNESLVIRRAADADAPVIARVHVQSWRESYKGIIPAEYLARLSAPAHERQWRRSFASGGWAFAAELEGELVGFASGGLSRGRREITGELFVLYVLARAQKRGVGRAQGDRL